MYFTTKDLILISPLLNKYFKKKKRAKKRKKSKKKKQKKQKQTTHTFSREESLSQVH
jgi:hypothetical protein